MPHILADCRLAGLYPHTESCDVLQLMQEALLYEPWEAAVLRHPGFEPVTCPDSGRLLFAGPRLRMGLAEGAPHSVAPDHSGRANYSVS
jgi:hypothetical protein